MSPNRHHAHPLAGGRLIAVYMLAVAGFALLATVLERLAG